MATCSNAINDDAESDWTPIVYVTQTLSYAILILQGALAVEINALGTS